jgi:hypothetical protein
MHLNNTLSNGAFADDLICLSGSLRNLHIQADKLTSYSIWAALQVSGSKTNVTGILHGAAKTGVWGKDPKKHLRTQLSNKILVQGQHAHFIEQNDPFTYLSVELTMSLNWTHQYTRMTKTLKQRLTGLRNSYAPPWQAIHIINTATMPSIAYAFPVTPCNPDRLNDWDNEIGSRIKHKFKFMKSTPTAMIRENKDDDLA